MPGRPESRSGYLPTLDGWRAIAILGVLISHAGADAFRSGGGHPNLKLLSLLSLGAYGVNIFFGISGFLRRVFRILPVSLLYLFVILVFRHFRILWVEPISWLASLLFFKNFMPDHSWYLSHFWSLSVEEQFYLLWPLLFLVVAGRGVFPTMVIAVLVQILAGNHVLPYVGLLWGCVFAFVMNEKETYRALARVLRPAIWVILSAWFLLGMAGKAAFFEWWEGPAIALLIVGTVARPDFWIARFLELSWLKWIGRCSYSIYIWQQLFCLDQTKSRPFHQWQEIPLNLAATFGLATASFYLVEKPMIRLGHRLARPATPGRDDLKI